MPKRMNVVKLIVAVDKAQAVDEFDTMESIQGFMASVLHGEWTSRVEQGIAAAVGYVAKSRKVSDQDVERARTLAAAPFQDWPSQPVENLMSDSVEQMYILAQTAVLKKWAGAQGYDVELVFKAEVEPRLGADDEAALEYLKDSQVFWVKGRYDEDTQKAIDAAALEDIVGQPGPAAGATLRKKLEKAHGAGAFAAVGEAYWTGLAVNASTTARVVGIINQLQASGVQKYVITNPMDDKTTDICSYLHGMEFQVEQQHKRVQEIVSAGDPATIKTLHPWHPHDWAQQFVQLGIDATRAPSETPDADAVLSQAGFGMPPYHFNCRSTVDIA